MFTHYLVLDFESYYSTKLKYTLRKMTPVEYLLDPRYETIGCAVIDKGKGTRDTTPRWIDALDFPAYVAELMARQRKGEKLVVISHNALFDMCLLAWKYGLVPDLMVDTLGMSRAELGVKLRSHSLASVATHLGIGEKGTTVQRVDGMTRQEIIAAGFYEAYARYSIKDAVLCEQIFGCLSRQFPPMEYLVIDTVIRCAVLPKFKYNTQVLYDHLETVKNAKQDLLAMANITPDADGKAPELMSNEKFAECLRSLGVEPPTKISITTGKETYAFAKSDQAMADLQEHPDPTVQALVAARLGVKSTLEESRTERFISISKLRWGSSNSHGGFAPIPLRYSGAHTHRFSGDWKLNKQNLPRGGRLRESLEAPEGYVVVTCDSSQIEARLAAWVAAQHVGEASELVAAFERGDDVYSLFAGKYIYNRVLDKKIDFKERFVGKQAILGLGFGMGYPRYILQVRKDSRLQLKIVIDLPEQEAQSIVNGYRKGMAPQVPKAWRFLQDNIINMQNGCNIQFGPVRLGHKEVIGPTGLRMYYPDLHQVPNEGRLEWQFMAEGKPVKLFGGKLYENIIQHLARCCNIEAALKVRRRTKIDLALQSHDELVYVVPGRIVYEMANGKRVPKLDGFAEKFAEQVHGIMCERPVWGPTLPLAAEVGFGYSYGSAK